jgi:IS605 OrfB family transposase
MRRQKLAAAPDAAFPKKPKRRRLIRPPALVAAPAKISTTTSLRLSEEDAAVISALGVWYGQQVLSAFNERNRLGHSWDKFTWARLRRSLTQRGMSARWAGAILAEAKQCYSARRAGLKLELKTTRSRIKTISARLAAGGGRAAKHTKRSWQGKREEVQPYPYRQRTGKNSKLQILTAREQRLVRMLASGRVSYCRGGRRLARARHNLPESQYADEAAWSRQWQAQRLGCFASPGESGKRGGNETIRLVASELPNLYWLELNLPASLAHLANQPLQRYRLSRPVSFNQRAEELATVLEQRNSIGYRVWLDLSRGQGNGRRKQWGRVYLSAAFVSVARPTRTSDIQTARSNGAIGVDLNDKRITARRVDRHGNPVGRPLEIVYDFAGLSASKRDGRLRHAVTLILKEAQRHNCSIAIENLNFEADKAASKETHSKRFRALIHGFPAAAFRDRLQAMAATAGVPVIAVDPAYTSKDGLATWGKALNLDRDHAAAITIARRALGLRLGRALGTSAAKALVSVPRGPEGQQRMADGTSGGARASIKRKWLSAGERSGPRVGPSSHLRVKQTRHKARSRPQPLPASASVGRER